MKAIKLYLGQDVHKDSITVAIAPVGRASETHFYGTITTTSMSSNRPWPALNCQ